MEILFQYDPCSGEFTGCDADKFVKAMFYNMEHDGCRIDTILWEHHRFLPAECPSNNRAEYLNFTARGIDMMERLIRETKARGMKAYLHHRFSEVDRGWYSPEIKNPIKAEHPDWLIRTWHEEGLWNMAHPEVRKFKLDYLKGILEKYEFDGICIDFLRHLPCLPVGYQWDYRHCVTEFLSSLREIAVSTGKQIAIGAKIPENPESCRIDGFDVETWCKEGIVDFLVCGSRTLNVDVGGFKAIAEGTPVKIYPCWDTWHSSDAHHWQEDAFYRGVFANWKAKQADGIVGFNYISAPHSVMETLHVDKETPCWPTREIKDFVRQIEDTEDPGKPMIFAAERRGGYPYSTGAGSSNFLAPLPLEIPNACVSGTVPVPVYADVQARKGKLRLLLSGAVGGKDTFRLWLNGQEITDFAADFALKDPRIHWPKPQQHSGAGYSDIEDPADLLEITASLPEGSLVCGENEIRILPIRAGFYSWHEVITVQRAELSVDGEG